MQSNGGALSPLFVLQEHAAAVLTCSFYPASTACHERSSLFLSGGVDGVVIVWDLSVRRSIFSFCPVDAACAETENAAAGAFVNRGVLEVGFIDCTALARADTTASSSGVAVPQPHTQLVATGEPDKQPAGRVARARFHVPRRAAGASSTTASGGGSSSNRDIGSRSVFFFTHCRNRNVYIWELAWQAPELNTTASPTPTVNLLHTLSVPQHGFCPVATVATPSDTDRGGEVMMAIPHDGDGLLSLWRVVAAKPAEGAKKPGDTAAASPSFPGPEQQRQPITAPPIDAAADDHARSPFQLTCWETFSASPSIKGGAIMHIAWCGAEHLCVAFESGHITLCECKCDVEGDNRQRGSARVLAAIRAFPETALSCWWSGDRLVATSAEGHVQCFRVVPRETASSGDVEHGNEDVSLELAWEVTLRKGLGSLVVQRHLVILASWDGTLRLYDVRTGRVVSVLPTRGGTVNEVAIAPPGVAAEALFSFNVRQPHVYREVRSGGVPGTPAHDGGGVEDQGTVYVFASTGGDGSVSVWRVDLNTITRLGEPARVEPRRAPALRDV